MRTIALCSAALALAGCSAAPQEPSPQRQVQDYFAANNAAARQGSAAQQEFFDRTQHPEFGDQVCELDGLTVQLEPALSTLRPDPGYSPDGAGPPRGKVFVVGVEVTVRRDGTITGRQVGSQHVVLLDGTTHGFAPCPSGSGS
ncbi:MAG: hypothetical protein IJH84_08285 [Saccharopolyspora sp.]|uniref:hypothetical protein n=1 Tax=unclassified Saccharopolyspora TaxID=2646250 RepID=UPI0025D480D1|nr:hypothetical protein [Saccharopolyspora sp.]MBQ6641017.1 hypothetical protein [Saccharopolyspora sp.]